MSAFTAVLMKVLSLFMSVVLMPLGGLTYGLDAISMADRTDEQRVNVVGVGAYFRSQGITTDGENFYFSSKTTLIETDSGCVNIVNMNLDAIPDELSDLGIKHIGGLSYYNGRIYAGMEDSKVWDYPIVGVFNPETLELENYYIMDAELITRGMPWVAVNPDNGYLYCMDHSKQPTKILVYDVNNDMNFVEEISLADTIPSIQGGEFRDGFLYVSTDDDTQAIYRVNVTDGTFEKYLDRNLTSGSEGEGMTFIEEDGETYIVAMDLGPIFVNAFVRRYDFT